MMPAESAHDTIGALGDVGLLQFKDLNADKSAFQRTYANQVGCLPAWGVAAACLGHRAGTYTHAAHCARARCIRAHATMERRASAAASPAGGVPSLCHAQVKRCDEMARKIRFFHDQVRRQVEAAP